MKSNQLLKQAFILLLIIAVLDVLSEIFYFHLTIWWYDIILHFLSGVCVSIGGVSFYFSLFKNNVPSRAKIIFTGLALAIFVGVLWEIFELHFGLTFLSDGIVYIRDTASDLIMDLSGGLLGVAYTINFLKDE